MARRIHAQAGGLCNLLYGEPYRGRRVGKLGNVHAGGVHLSVDSKSTLMKKNNPSVAVHDYDSSGNIVAMEIRNP